MKKIDIASYKVVSDIKLEDLSTSENLDSTDKELKKNLEKLREDLGDFQNTLIRAWQIRGPDLFSGDGYFW